MVFRATAAPSLLLRMAGVVVSSEVGRPVRRARRVPGGPLRRPWSAPRRRSARTQELRARKRANSEEGRAEKEFPLRKPPRRAAYPVPAEHWIHLRTTNPIVILSRSRAVLDVVDERLRSRVLPGGRGYLPSSSTRCPGRFDARSASGDARFAA